MSSGKKSFFKVGKVKMYGDSDSSTLMSISRGASKIGKEKTGFELS